jgi:rhamnose transport system ATP-binding protein
MQDKPILSTRNIWKSFPGVQALQSINLDIFPAEIHAVVGENGSGKSTLMKIISGVYKSDKGDLYLDGNHAEQWNPVISQKSGISAIYQELSLFPDLSVAENVFLGHDQFVRAGKVHWRFVREETQRLLSYLKVESINPRDRVETLSVAERQIVEIVKAIAATRVRILLMDEPTSALSLSEVTNLFEVMRKLRQDGVGIIFISHKLDEVFKIAEKITVLRDGQLIESKKSDELSHDGLIKLMIGRDISNLASRRSFRKEKKVFEVKNLCKSEVFRNITFDLYEGEILGIFGLVGAKRTELAQAIFGITSVDSGEIYINGVKVNISRADQALNLGVGLIPEDRASEGLVLQMDITENVTLPILHRLFPSLIIKREKERTIADKICKDLEVKYGDLQDIVDSLSGGNKQKIVLAKWMLTKAKILIFDEPTKGIDVGAKEVIHNLMQEIIEAGVSVIMISSELLEILKMSDRILVMAQGNITGQFEIAEATQEKLIRCASTFTNQSNAYTYKG